MFCHRSAGKLSSFIHPEFIKCLALISTKKIMVKNITVPVFNQLRQKTNKIIFQSGNQA
jgi:hypothetical protein